jgi:hypothetical protein
MQPAGLPAVAQFPEFQKHRARIRTVEPEKCVHLVFLRQRRNKRIGWILVLVVPDHLLRKFVIGLAIERKAQVVDQVIVSRVDKRIVAEP